MPVHSQTDIVREASAQEERVVREKLLLPGIKELHTRPIVDIAEVLANTLKARTNVSEVHWVLGKYIELVYEKTW